MRPRSVREVVENGLCTGCGLCEALGGAFGVRMKISERGFYRPTAAGELPDAVTRQILSVCPGAVVARPGSAGRAASSTIWGPIRAMHRAHAADPQVRYDGSSGGVLSALSAYLLQSGEVDGVVQVAAGPDDPLTNRVVVSRTVQEVVSRAGSRYAPSAPLSGLGDLLDGKERFALVGKPCDIAGVRQLALRDARVDRVIPWMLSFFCAGVPSAAGSRELLTRVGLQESEVAAVRYRGQGWPGRFKAETRDGRSLSLSYGESWGEVLSRHLQFRCKICPDGTGEFADVSAADAWSTADGYPDFEERDGWSAVLARTARGERLLQGAAADGTVVLRPIGPEELSRMQPYQRDRKRAALVRYAAVLLAGGAVPSVRGMRLARAAIQSLASWPRNFAGTFLRVLRGTHRE